MDEQASVPSVVYQVDTEDCGSAILDYIRDTVESNSEKLDRLLACNSCNDSSTTPMQGMQLKQQDHENINKIDTYMQPSY